MFASSDAVRCTRTCCCTTELLYRCLELRGLCPALQCRVTTVVNSLSGWSHQAGLEGQIKVEYRCQQSPQHKHRGERRTSYYTHMNQRLPCRFNHTQRNFVRLILIPPSPAKEVSQIVKTLRVKYIQEWVAPAAGCSAYVASVVFHVPPAPYVQFVLAFAQSELSMIPKQL